MDRSELVAKFRDNAVLAIPEARAARVVELVDALPASPRLDALMDALTA
jgi:hypothetical protein